MITKKPNRKAKKKDKRMLNEHLTRFYPLHPENFHHLSKSEPLSIEMMQEILQEDAPLAALPEICLPYEVQDATTLLNPSAIESCIDDRPRIIQAIPAQSIDPSIQIGTKPYSIEHLSEGKMAHREMLGSRPWPGGRYGVDMMVFVADIISGAFSFKDFNNLHGSEFVEAALAYVTAKSNSILEGIPLPIHIDNDHGKVSLFTHKKNSIEPDCGRITQLLNAKKGCGAHQHSLEVIGTLLTILGKNEEAQDLIAKCDGWFDENGIARVPDSLLGIAANVLFDNAIQTGSPVDIVIGPHDPHGTVFSTGNHTVNRRFVEAFINPTELLFKADLGVVRNEQSLAAQIGGRITNAYGSDVFNLEQFALGINFATLGVLGQQKLSRYIIT